MVKMLLDAGADPDKANNADETPLYQAAENGLEEVVKLLLQAGADPDKYDEEGISPLNKAVQRGNLKVVTLLLKGGAVADEEDIMGIAELAVDTQHALVIKSFTSYFPFLDYLLISRSNQNRFLKGEVSNFDVRFLANLDGAGWLRSKFRNP